MRTVAASFCVILALIPTSTLSQRVNGFKAFYDTATFGQVGLVESPKRKGGSTVSLLTPFRAITIAPRGEVDFVVDHHDQTGNNTSSDNNYLSVLMVIVHDASARMDPSEAPLLTLFRNEGWNSVKWYPPTLRKLELYFYSHDNGQNFVDKIRSLYRGSDIHALDTAFRKTRFDGSPDNRDLDSWDTRDFWDKPQNSPAECRNASVPCTTKYYLLKFAPNSDGASDKPLQFIVSTWGVSRILLFVDSPLDTRFKSQYEIDLTANH